MSAADAAGVNSRISSASSVVEIPTCCAKSKTRFHGNLRGLLCSWVTRISSPRTSQDTMNPSEVSLPDFSGDVLMSSTRQRPDSFGLDRAQLDAKTDSHCKDNLVAPLTNVKSG